MIRSGLLIGALLLLCIEASAQTPPLTPADIVKNIQKTYSRQCCFMADFDQLTVNVAMDLTDRFQGIMYVKKPALIMLEVRSPERQKVLVQGRAYTVYFPDEGGAARGEIPPELNLEHFFGFFANLVNIDENFIVSFPAKAVDVNEKLYFLELADKKTSSGTFNIMIGVDTGNFTIRRAIIYDALGNYNRFDLTSIKFLNTIPDSQFQIVPETGDSQNVGK